MERVGIVNGLMLEFYIKIREKLIDNRIRRGTVVSNWFDCSLVIENVDNGIETIAILWHRTRHKVRGNHFRSQQGISSIFFHYSPPHLIDINCNFYSNHFDVIVISQDANQYFLLLTQYLLLLYRKSAKVYVVFLITSMYLSFITFHYC